MYPVPDGDTGTNLKLTLAAVIRELDGSSDPCASITRGSLMGARGNSGVILSQLFRGIAEAVGRRGRARPRVARAPGCAADPTSRTRPSCSRRKGRSSPSRARRPRRPRRRVGDGDDLVESCRRVVGRAQDALDRTPELLPILKQAGVVDAGGRGFLLFLECLLHALDGTPLPPPRVPAKSPAEAIVRRARRAPG